MNLNLSLNESTINPFEYKENWNSYIFSSLCIIGSFTSIINIIVFFKIRQKDQIFKYYLTTSIFDFMYTVCLAFQSLVNCGTPCTDQRGLSLAANLYQLIIFDYLTSAFAIIGIFVELFISVQRLLLVVNNPFLTNLNPELVLIIIVTFGLFYYIPVLYTQNIKNIGPHAYRLEYTQFGNSQIGKLFPLIMSTIRLLLASIVLISINLITLFQFTKRIKKESVVHVFVTNLETENASLNFLIKNRKFFTNRLKAKKNITLMVISIAFTYTIGSLPWALYYGLSELLRTKSFFIHTFLYTIGAIFLYLLIIFKFFVYLFFNRLYRLMLKTLIKKYCACSYRKRQKLN